MQITMIMLCTADKRYAESFAGAVNFFSKETMQVKVFTCAESLTQSLKEESMPELILTEPQMYEAFCRCCEEAEPEQKIKDIWSVYKDRVCILTELPEEEDLQPEAGAVPRICKYKAMETVLANIREILDIRKREVTGHTHEGTPADEDICSLIGFYSPVRRTGQSTYAKKLAAEAGENIPVLYMNLDSYDGDSRSERDTLADLLYYIQQEDMVFQRAVQKVAWQEENFHQILPMPLPMDLWNVTEKQWKELFYALREKSIYKKIYLDFGDGSVRGLFDLLELCDVIYMPIDEDDAALRKLIQYEKTLAVLGKQEILKKTRRVCLRSHE